MRALSQVRNLGAGFGAKRLWQSLAAQGRPAPKKLIAALLGERFVVGKTEGNLNNHLGLPLTLLRIPEEAQVAVVEMGMNHAGEIRELARIAQPQIGVVTNVGYAHIEAFESIDAIAAAKRELIEELPPDGVAVLNADDERVLAFREIHRGRILTYGTAVGADIRAEQGKYDAEGASFSVRGIQFQDKANRTACCFEYSGRPGGRKRLSRFPLEALVSPVARLQPGKMRGERYQARGITILNDSYNSNPAAAAVDDRRAGRRTGQPQNRRVRGNARAWPLGRATAPRVGALCRRARCRRPDWGKRRQPVHG